MWILKGCWSADHTGTIGQDIAQFSSQHGAEQYFSKSQVKNAKRGDPPFVRDSILSGFMFASIRHEKFDPDLIVDPLPPSSTAQTLLNPHELIFLSSDDLTPAE